MKRILSLCLALVLLVGAVSAAAFADVPNGSWYKETVDWAVDLKITNGTDATHFSPDKTCTRAEFVTLLYRTAKEHRNFFGFAPLDKDSPNRQGDPGYMDFSESEYGLKFTDVKRSDYFFGAVSWAVAEGIIAGTSATTFSPYDLVTREQVAVILERFAKEWCGYHLDELYAEQAFTPSDPVSKWAEQGMRFAIGAKLLQGDGTGWHGMRACTRAEALTLLMRFVKSTDNFPRLIDGGEMVVPTD